MSPEQVLALFVKAEKNLASLLKDLPLVEGRDQVNKLASIQQTSYLLERLNRALFQKITLPQANQLKALRNNYPQMKEIERISVDTSGIKFTHLGQHKIAPLLNYQTVIKEFVKDPTPASGQSVQISFLLRPENYLDICLISFWRQNG
jgi:hypothetical protein